MESKRVQEREEVGQRGRTVMDGRKQQEEGRG
jgi:hypothetical protein